MSIIIRVKTRLAAIAAFLLPLSIVAADPMPDARDLLKQARMAQANLDLKFNGHLRIGSGSKKIPFVLTISDGVVRYEFQDTKDTLTLRPKKYRQQNSMIRCAKRTSLTKTSR
jgi:hypothetical protein